jgi:acetyl esterase/lipase
MPPLVNMQRRNFLLSLASAPLCRAAQSAAPPDPRVFVYKSASGCDIRADVWGMPLMGRRPAAVWIHGGALIMGSRRLSKNSRVLTALLDAGFTVISIDYRLAPETKLPGIIEDVQDAWEWLHAQAPMLRIDAARIGVCGGSAGGYLTLMTGFRLRPRPKALVSFWGYGEIAGPWYSRPDPFYLQQPRVSREEALASVGSAAISEPPEKNERHQFYLYCRQNGLWPKEVTGHDPGTENGWFDPYCPIRNVTHQYPPTMLVHGTADTDVPYEQSKMMAAHLEEAGVKHEFVTVPEGGHGIGNISPEEQQRIYRNAAAYLHSRV